MRISKRQRELEALAWAGGFFDGEGSTFARSLTSRPGYRQLNVIVPQNGDATVPEVLSRFATAMNGMGNISGPFNGLYQWRATDRAHARAAVILLRPFVGRVKRRQAARAIALVNEQYASGRIHGRPERRRAPLVVRSVGRAQLTREARARLDRAWAAGFLDGEGWFGLVRAQQRIGGPRWYRIRASASQIGENGKPPQVLVRLRGVVGVGRIEPHGRPDTFKWVAEGIPALARVLETVGPWLGPVKREQARQAMATFTGQTHLKGDDVRCKRGHAYDRVTRPESGSIKRRCNACARLLGRRKRAASGIAPRAFTDRARRYTE